MKTTYAPLKSLVLLATLTKVSSEPVPIRNPSFEDLTGPPSTEFFDETGRLKVGKFTQVYFGTFQGGLRSGAPVPGWHLSYGGTSTPGGSAFDSAPDGNNFVYLGLDSPNGWATGEPSLSQTLCRRLKQGRYTLRVSVGDSRNANPGGYRVQLRAGGSIVAEDNNSQVVGNGQFIESTVEVDVPANHPQINQFLEIWLGAAFPAGQSRFTYFDKVSLDGPPSECERFADSITDFSTTQGAGGWDYGYYDESNDPSPGYDSSVDFVQFPSATSADMAFSSVVHDIWNINANSWAAIGSVSMLPNSGGNNSSRPPREQVVIRRWVSNVDGFVRIHGRVAKLRVDNGDGVIAMIYVNGREVYRRDILQGDDVGDSYSVVTGLKVGDKVDFAVKSKSSVTHDYTYFSAKVDPARQELEVFTALEIGVPTAAGVQYQLEGSTDLGLWQTNGLPSFLGSGGVDYILFSTREFGDYKFFRIRND